MGEKNTNKIDMKYGLIGLHDEEQLGVIEELWYNEAAGYRDAGITLRTDMDPKHRSEALDFRVQHMEHCDALLDAYSELRATLGFTAIAGA